jgi:uncharacterized protein with NAD-binding domain and iron-sulfur cluster
VARQGKGGKARDWRLHGLRCERTSFVIFPEFYKNITKQTPPQMCSGNCGSHLSALTYTGNFGGPKGKT